MTIEMPDDQTVALAAKARAQGLSAEEYARLVLERDLVPEWLRKSWESARQAGLDTLSMDEIDAEIAAARKARSRTRNFGLHPILERGGGGARGRRGRLGAWERNTSVASTK